MAKKDHRVNLWFCPNKICNPHSTPHCRANTGKTMRCPRCQTQMAQRACQCSLCQNPNPTKEDRERAAKIATEWISTTWAR